MLLIGLDYNYFINQTPQLMFVNFYKLQTFLIVLCYLVSLLTFIKTQSISKKSFIFMFGILAKTLNSKYNKYITNYPAKYLGKSQIQVFSQQQSQTSKFLKSNFNPKIISSSQNSRPKLLGSGHLLDLELQKTFNPLEIFNEQYKLEQTKSPLIEYDPSQLTLQNVQTIQYQANNPIQDRLICGQLKNIPALCLNVFDGHGGSMLSDYASKKIVELIDSYLGSHLIQIQAKDQKQRQTIIKESIQWAYQQIEQKFYQILENQFKTGNKEILKIGSCAITAIIYSNTIIVGNCGDSQSIIVTDDSQGLSYFKANEPLSVNNQQERKKLLSKFQGIDDQVLVKTKYNKTYLKGFLQPTRTLGDYYLKKQKYYNKIANSPYKGPYLTCEPDFTMFQIRNNYKYMIIASDGLWDFISKKDILHIVQQSIDKNDEQSGEFSLEDLNKTYIEKPNFFKNQKLTETLKNHVLQKCAKKKGKSLDDLQNVPSGQKRNYCDDISIIVVSFKENN